MKHKISQLMFNKYRDCIPPLPDYNPTADCEWIRHESGLPWLQLDINVPHQEILKEIANVQSLLSLHRDEYGEHLGWYSFCMHGKSYDATREDNYYNDTRPHTWTSEAVNLMPNTVKYFSKEWPGSNFSRVRVMLLEPGGYISVHKDYGQSKLVPINIAITQPKDCSFLMERHGIVPFTPGSAFLLDVSNNHTVFNDDIHPRWHIIAHQSFEQIKTQNIVVSSYKTLYNKE